MPSAPRAVVDAAARTFRSLTFDRRMAAGLFVLMALLPLLSPVLGGSYLLHTGERALILGLAAISLELLIGVAGMVSFGHAAFLGIGAYAAGIAASHGLGTLSVALPAALAASAAFALVTGAIAVRTHGVYFIMITLAFGQMAFFVATSLAPYGGDDGLAWPTRTLVLGTRLLEDETVFFYATLAAAFAAYVLVSRLTAARFGRVLRGLTGSEPRMEAIGFAPYPFRLTAYVIAGAMCGLAGFLLGNHAEFVSPAYMHWQRSGELIVAVLLGGTGTAYGPLLGAVVFVLLEETLSRLTEHWKAILGPILVIVVLFAKGGMAGGIEHAMALWHRRRITPRELLVGLPAFVERRVAAWSAAAVARFRALEAVAGRHLDRLALVCRQGLAEAGARWEPLGRSVGRQAGAIGAMAERGLARLLQHCRQVALALERRVEALLLCIKGALGEARARWQHWKMALGRRLVALALCAERRVAGAADRWRRR